MNLTQREKIFVIVGLVFVSFAIYYKYLLYPKIIEVNWLKISYNHVLKDYQISQEANHTKYDDSINKYKNEIDVFNEIIPVYRNEEDFLSDIDTFKKASNIQLQSIDFGMNGGTSQNNPQGTKSVTQNNKNKAYVAYPVLLNISGGYSNVSNFITLLQDSKRLVDIKSILLTRSDKGVSASIDLYIFYKKDSFAHLPKINGPGKSDPFKLLTVPTYTTDKQNNTATNTQASSKNGGNSSSASGSKSGNTNNAQVKEGLKQTLNKIIDSMGTSSK